MGRIKHDTMVLSFSNDCFNGGVGSGSGSGISSDDGSDGGGGDGGGGVGDDDYDEHNKTSMLW